MDKFVLSCLISMLFFVSSTLAVSISNAKTKTTGIPKNSWYMMTIKHSKKCVDIYAWNKNNGGSVKQWDCLGGGNQKFRMLWHGDGTATFFNQHSGKALDVAGNSKDKGVHIIQWDHHGGANQAWFLQSTDEGYFRLRSKHSGKCLDVSGASKDNGALLIQWDW